MSKCMESTEEHREQWGLVAAAGEGGSGKGIHDALYLKMY